MQDLRAPQPFPSHKCYTPYFSLKSTCKISGHPNPSPHTNATQPIPAWNPFPSHKHYTTYLSLESTLLTHTLHNLPQLGIHSPHTNTTQPTSAWNPLSSHKLYTNYLSLESLLLTQMLHNLPQLGIHHSRGIVASPHLAGAGGVVVRSHPSSDQAAPVIIRVVLVLQAGLDWCIGQLGPQDL